MRISVGPILWERFYEGYETLVRLVTGGGEDA